MASGGDVSSFAFGDASFQGGGTATVSSAGLQVHTALDSDLTAGRSSSLTAGDSVSVAAAKSGTATFGDSLSVSAGSVQMASTSSLVGVAETVDVTGAAGVRVGSAGAAMELSGTDGVTDYVAFAWRASSSFDRFSNSVPVVTGVAELIVRSVDAGGARVESTSGDVTAHIGLAATPSGTPTRVWSSSVGSGSYSLDGLRVHFERQDVHAIELSSTGADNDVFQGWSDVVIHFGQTSGAGSMSMSAASVLEATSGESLAVSSKSVTVSAGNTLSVSAVAAVDVSAGSLDVVSDSVRGSVGNAAVQASGDMELSSGGAVTMASTAFKVNSVDSLDVASAELAAVSANVAVVDLSESVELSTSNLKVRSGDNVEVYSGEGVDVHTSDFTVNAGGSVTAFAGEHAEVSTATAIIDASESLTVQTGDLRVIPSGVVELAATASAKLVATSVDVASSGDASLSAVTGMAFSTASGDLDFSAAGGKLKSNAEAFDLKGGVADVQLVGEAELITASTATVAGLSGLAASTAGSAVLTAASGLVEVAGRADASVGGSSAVAVGGDMAIGANGAVTATAETIKLTAGALGLDSVGALNVGVAEVDVKSLGDIRLSSPSSSVRATEDGQFSFFGFQLPGGSGFDDFENLLPTVEGAQSVLIRGAMNQALQLAAGTRARLQLLDADSGTWFEAWSLIVNGAGQDLNGLSQVFEMANIGGFRLSSIPPQNPTFVNWGNAIISFGVHGGRTLAVSSLGVVEVTGAEALRLDSSAVSVGAGSSLDIGSAGTTSMRSSSFDLSTADDTIMVAGRDMHLQALDDVKIASGGELHADADTASVHVSDSLTAAAGGELSLSSGSTASVDSTGTLSLSSAATVDMVAAQSLLFSAPSYDMQASQGFSVATASAVEVSGAQLLVHTDDYAHVTSNVLSVAANTSAEFVTGGAMDVSAASVDLASNGELSVVAADAVTAQSGAGMSLHAGADLSVVAGEAAELSSKELAITTGYHQITMAGPDSELWEHRNFTKLHRRLDGGAVHSDTSRMDVTTHGDAVLAVAEQLTLSARLLAATVAGDSDVAVGGGLTFTVNEEMDVSAEAVSVVSPDVALTTAELKIEAAETASVAVGGDLSLVGTETVSVETDDLSMAAGTAAHIEAADAGATVDLSVARVAIASDKLDITEHCAPPVCTLTPVVAEVVGVAEGCASTTNVVSDCLLIPADPTANPPFPGSCVNSYAESADDSAVCTYVPAVEAVAPVTGSCSAGCGYLAPITAVEAVAGVTGVTEACVASVGTAADNCVLTTQAEAEATHVHDHNDHSPPQGSCAVSAAGVTAGASCAYVAPVEAVQEVIGVTGVEEGCIASTCTLTAADPAADPPVAGSCAGAGCTYVPASGARPGASVELSHSEAVSDHAQSAVKVKADELSFDGTLTTVAADRTDKKLSGFVMASGGTLVGSGARFLSELQPGDVVRAEGGSENRVVVSVQTDSLARIDAPFRTFIAPSTPFIIDRPLMDMNRAAGTHGHTAETGEGSRFTVTADGRLGVGTASPRSALEVNGGIRSQMWELHKVIPYSAGMLPRSGTIRTHGGTWKLTVSAQAMRASDDAPNELVVEVLVDNRIVGRLWTVYNGPPGVNVAIPADTMVLNDIAPGDHTVTMRCTKGTTDANSVAQAVLEVMPW